MSKFNGKQCSLIPIAKNSRQSRKDRICADYIRIGRISHVLPGWDAENHAVIVVQLDEQLCSVIGIFPIGLTPRKAVLNLLGNIGTIRYEDRPGRCMPSYQLQVIGKTPRLFLTKHV